MGLGLLVQPLGSKTFHARLKISCPGLENLWPGLRDPLLYYTFC